MQTIINAVIWAVAVGTFSVVFLTILLSFVVVVDQIFHFYKGKH